MKVLWYTIFCFRDGCSGCEPNFASKQYPMQTLFAASRELTLRALTTPV
jgi:hypothetical protein